MTNTTDRDARLGVCSWRDVAAGLRDRPTRGGAFLFLALIALSVGTSDISTAEAASFDAAVAAFEPYVSERVAESLGQAKLMRERIAARDLAGAQQAWLAARGGWESAEVVSDEFFPDLDAAIDAWPDAQTGFHAIEAKLFGAHLLDVLPEADALVTNLTEFDAQLHRTALTPQGLLNGITKLAYEIGESKAGGGESPYSGSSVAEMGDNLAGIKKAYETVFAPTLEARDPRLGQATERAIDRLQQIVAVTDVKALDQDELRKSSEELALTLRTAAPVMGLVTPNLEN